MDNPDHKEHQNLISDIKAINSNDLAEHIAKLPRIDGLAESRKDKETARRAYFLISALQDQINELRKCKLTEIAERPSPYNFENLLELEVNKYHLVKMNDFNQSGFCLGFNEMVYMLCPVDERSNSSYWLSQVLLKQYILSKRNFRIRLDPLKEIHEDQYNPVEYKMHVHGKPLNWEKIKIMRDDDFGQWFNEKEHDRAGFTDYVWSPRESTIHFTCEEVPKINYEGILSSRYFHAIINKNTGKINHCDGAIRFYSKEELINRTQYQVKDPEARKVGKRVKIFQFDSADNDNIEMERDDLTELVVNFFFWNHDVLNYFN